MNGLKTTKHVLTVAAFAVTAICMPAVALSNEPTEQSGVSATAASGIAPHSTEADSCAAAFATVMAQYLKPEIAKLSAPQSDLTTEFVKGVAHAFETKHTNTPYFLGVRSGLALIDRLEQMQQMGFPITVDAFIAQLTPALKSGAMGFNEKSADEFLRNWMLKMYPEPEMPHLTPESQQAYLDEQKAREGVVETPSGLLFEVITEGEGAQPTDTDFVRVTYAGRLTDGTVFDSTERPVQFPVGNLVPGFTEGLKMMKIGGDYRIIIPPHLGYGDKGAAGVIPPGAVLDFTIHLDDIVNK